MFKSRRGSDTVEFDSVVNEILVKREEPSACGMTIMDVLYDEYDEITDRVGEEHAEAVKFNEMIELILWELDEQEAEEERESGEDVDDGWNFEEE